VPFLVIDLFLHYSISRLGILSGPDTENTEKTVTDIKNVPAAGYIKLKKEKL
jgi:hypothetical protein